MVITFLIGNGFDLNIGLRTTYSAFLKEYKRVTSEDTDLLKYFKSKILCDEEIWANAERAFGQATKKFKDDGYNAEDFCKCHEDFCLKLATYLRSQEQRLHYTSLDDVISNGFSKGIKSFKKGFRETETAKITAIENMFSNGFIFNVINFNYTAVADLCFESLRSKSGLVGTRVTTRGTASNSLGRIIHVHGTVDKDMVLGVNDASQISEPSLFDGFEEIYVNELIKQKTNEINQEDIDNKAFNILKESDIIYIYGMSIGETDKLWWQRICELMRNKSYLHVIIHNYKAPLDGLIRRQYLLFTNDVKKSFTAHSQFNDSIRREIEGRIHVCATNIFDDLNGLVDDPNNKIEQEEVA